MEVTVDLAEWFLLAVFFALICFAFGIAALIADMLEARGRRHRMATYLRPRRRAPRF